MIAAAAATCSFLLRVQEIHAFHLGEGVGSEFRAVAEEGDFSELLVRAPIPVLLMGFV